MQPRTYLIIVASIALLGVGGFFVWQSTTRESTVVQSTNISTTNTQVADTRLPEIDPQVQGDTTDVLHPVSLPALMEKEYDGRDFTVGSVQATTAVYTRYYVTYMSGDLKISGIMNVPKGDGPYPVLILNHGYIDPAIYTNGRGLKREQDYLASRGYIVIHTDYRNHAQSDKDPNADVNFRLGYAEDSINAVKAIQASGLSYVDGSRIGMLGHSMGGGVTQNVMVIDPELVDAAVLFAPVSRNAVENYERWTKSRPETAQEIVDLYGMPDENPTFWDNVSASTFFDRIQTPIMIHHGTADDSVPIEWSDRLDEQLRSLGKYVEYYVYPGQPHEFTTVWGEVMRKTADFFDKHVKNG